MRELYADLGGNYQSALSRMMNDALIGRLLKKFLAYDIAPLANAKTAQELFQAAHGLKGVAGNLALDRLAELASKLTEATREKEGEDLSPYADLQKATVEEFHREIGLIQAKLG